MDAERLQPPLVGLDDNVDNNEMLGNADKLHVEQEEGESEAVADELLVAQRDGNNALALLVPTVRMDQVAQLLAVIKA